MLADDLVVRDDGVKVLVRVSVRETPLAEYDLTLDFVATVALDPEFDLLIELVALELLTLLKVAALLFNLELFKAVKPYGGHAYPPPPNELNPLLNPNPLLKLLNPLLKLLKLLNPNPLLKLLNPDPIDIANPFV